MHKMTGGVPKFRLRNLGVIKCGNQIVAPEAEVDIAPLFGTPANGESPFNGFPVKKIDTTLFYS